MRKECPMCGDAMTIVVRRQTDRVPGTRETHVREIREWRCGECDHFEEADSDERTDR